MKKLILLIFAAVLAVCSISVSASEADSNTERPTALYDGSKAYMQKKAASDTLTPGVPMGQEMPEVSYVTLDGATFDTAQVLKEKKAVLINFFRVQCPFCVEEFPIFNELMEEYGDQAAFLALDSSMYDSPEDIKELRDQIGIKIPVAQETEWVLSDIIPYEGYPCTVVLDKNNTLVFYQDYALASADNLKEVFDAILAEDYEGGYEQIHEYSEIEAAFYADDTEAAQGYTIVVKDQNGEPVADVMVNFCSETQQTCRMNATNSSGEIFFEVPEDVYHIAILAAPEGYHYDADFELYTEDHYGDPVSITITKD